jgi:Restriction endonuclease
LIFDRELARQLWEVAKTAANSNLKGKALELTAAYFFVAVAGFEVRLRVLGLDSEFDLILRSPSPDDPVHRVLGTYVLVECKNTRDKTAASEVRNFSAKVRFAGCTSGVLVTRAGLTGRGGGTVSDAAYAVRKSYHRDGSIILLIDGEDIQRVVDGRVAFRDLLVQRYEEIRFDLET